MTTYVLANNVNTTLATAAGSTATTLTLSSSSNLPSLSAGQIMPLTLNDAATGLSYEIVYVTAISGTTLTVTRAQENTGALNWSAGDYAYCALTAGTAAVTTGNANTPFQAGAPTGSSSVVTVSTQGHGQCRLSVASTTSLVLKPYNGDNVVVNSITLQLPSGGVSISNSGLAASTVYYVYLAGTTASPSLVLSTTGHVTGSNGVEVMSGDATKTLVGMISTNSSSQFASSTAQIFCLNWFNRRKLLGNEVLGTATTTSTGATELSTSLRISFLCWSDDIPQQFAYGNLSNGSASVSTVVAGYIDGSQAGISQSYASTTANFGAPFSLSSPASLTEGSHLATIYGNVGSASTGTYSINHTIMVTG